MRIVNIIPTQNSVIRLAEWEISSPAFNVSLSNEDIYKCINQKGLVYEIINGTQVLITLSNIKKDLTDEAEAEAEAKKTEIEKLNKIIEDLRREIKDLKEDHIFATLSDAEAYAKSSVSTIGEIISVLTSDKSKYIAYMIEPDNTLSPISSDEATEVQSVIEKVNLLSDKITTSIDKVNLLETEISTLSSSVDKLKNKKSSFDTLDEAKEYALDASLSNTGEMITVKSGTIYIPYIINPDRTIIQLTTGSKITVIQ